MSLDKIPTKPLPPGYKSQIDRIKEQYEKDKAEGKIDNNSNSNNQTNTKQNGQDLKAQINKAKEPETLERAIKNYLAEKLEYKVNVDGNIITKKRRDLYPEEAFYLFELVEYHQKQIYQVANIQRKRLFYQQSSILLERKGLNTQEDLDKYDNFLNQMAIVNDKLNKIEWTFQGQVFESEYHFATFLYSEALRLCIELDPQDFSKSAFRSNMVAARDNDVWGTRHIADACIEVESKSYAYFPRPSSSSSES